MGGTKRVSPVREIESALEKHIQTLPDSVGRLPSETHLAAQFGVSRVTLREALSSLEQRGLIIRKQGLGTFVNRATRGIATRLDECIEYGSLIRRSGYAAALSFLEWRVAPLSTSIAEALEVEPGTEALVTRKVFNANDKPVILCDNYIPLSLAPAERRAELLERFNPHWSVYNIAARLFEHIVTYQVSEVSARAADVEAARILQCAPGTGLLAIGDIGFTDSQRPVFYGDNSFVSGQFHFQLVRKAIYELDESV
jgi:GntR family transcriptional regulator